MQIRAEQLKVLSEAQRTTFENRAVLKLGPDSDLEPEQLKPRIHQLIEEASAFHIERECDVIRFLELRLFLSEQQWQSPDFQWIAEYLGEPVPAAYRLDLVEERLRFGGVLFR